MFINNVLYRALDYSNDHYVAVNDHVSLQIQDLYSLHSHPMQFDLHKKILCPDYAANLCVAELNKKFDLSSIDYWILPNAGFMLSQQYVSAPLYWKNKYKMRAEIIEVKGCGILCVLESFLLLQSLFIENKNYKMIIMSIENFYPLRNKAIFQFPYFGYTIITNYFNNVESYKILTCEKMVAEIEIDYFEKLIQKHGILKNKIACYAKQTEKLKKYFSGFALYQINFFYNSGFIYYCLSMLCHFFEYILLVESDGNTIGYLLVRRNFDDGKTLSI